MAHHIASQRTTFEGNRVLFNQVRLATLPPESLAVSPSPTVVVPMALKVISSPIRPTCPTHFGQTLTMPHATNWKDALFANDNKMLTTGTFSAPMLRSAVPPDKLVLRSQVACRVRTLPSSINMICMLVAVQMDLP
jgi:hypothetical protein